MSEFLESAPTLIDAFVAAVSAVPDSDAHVSAQEAGTGSHGRIDYVVDAHVAGKHMTMLVETKQTAFPRDVRDVVWRLRAYKADLEKQSGGPLVSFLIAETISPGARELLRTEGVGYFDGGGSLFVPTPGAFVFIDRPAAKNQVRALGSIFHGRKAQVLLALFDRRDAWVSVNEIADASLVSPSTTSQTLTDLERRDWMQVRGSGPSKERRLVEAAAMIDAWVRYVATQKPPRRRRYYIPASTADELCLRLARTCEDHEARYAITGEAAAQHYAPYLSSVSQVSGRMLANAEAGRALAALGARPVDSGWNLAVLETGSAADLAQTEMVDDLRLAKPLQVYLDLQFGSGRAKEMADHLRRERLRV
jgi:hypothetical protein